MLKWVSFTDLSSVPSAMQYIDLIIESMISYVR